MLWAQAIFLILVSLFARAPSAAESLLAYHGSGCRFEVAVDVCEQCHQLREADVDSRLERRLNHPVDLPFDHLAVGDGGL